MEKNTNKYNKIAYVISIIGLVLITLGSTYSLLSFRNEGTKSIRISNNDIYFKYYESAKGIKLTNAMPMTDNEGKNQTNYFEFEIESKTTSSLSIPYSITLKKSADSSNIDDAIKLYLTKLDNYGRETEVRLIKLADLPGYTNSNININSQLERLLYNSIVDENVIYRQVYRLRMWIDYDTDFTQAKYNNATFNLKVNAYTSE